jgi:hypothetical protein
MRGRSRRRTLLRRAGHLVAALATGFGLVAAAAGPATATGLGEQTCAWQTGRYNVCIRADRMAADQVWVHVGIDVTMSESVARQIVDTPGEEFAVTLYGIDGSSSAAQHPLAVIPMTWDAAGSGGLSAEFDVFLDYSVLDEDDGRDEVLAKVTLRVLFRSQTFTYQTNQIEAMF